MEEILVSVIMPVHNCAKYIKQTIDSVLAQKVSLELLILDDASTDDLETVLAPFLTDERISFYKNETNLGVAKTRNKGVTLAKGKYIAYLDADDFWDETKLEKQLALLEESDAVLCSAARELMYPDGSSTGKVIPTQTYITYQMLQKHNMINCSAVVLKREIAMQYKMEYDDSHEDYITWLKITRDLGAAIAINEPLLKCRLSEGGKSRNKLKSAIMTYHVYKYMGYSRLKSLYLFLSYMLHGLWKYR